MSLARSRCFPLSRQTCLRYPRSFRFWSRFPDTRYPHSLLHGHTSRPLPTAILSSQTSGMSGFSFCDLTEEMPRFLEHWASLGLAFDCVYSGFLGNPAQIDIARKCMEHFLLPTGFAFVDPVLGDNGRLDPTQTPEMVAAQRHLISHAQIIAPNLTEAAFLLNEPYREDLPLSALKDELVELSKLGPEMVVITSAPAQNDAHCAVLAYERTSHRFLGLEQ